MKAYGYNEIGEFTGEVDCQPNPLVWGEFIVPGKATMVKPPKQKSGNMRVWNGEKWVYQPIPGATDAAPAEEETPATDAAPDDTAE